MPTNYTDLAVDGSDGSIAVPRHACPQDRQMYRGCGVAEYGRRSVNAERHLGHGGPTVAFSNGVEGANGSGIHGVNDAAPTARKLGPSMWMVPGSLAIGSTELVPGEVREHLHFARGRAQSVPPEKLEQIEQPHLPVLGGGGRESG